MDSRREKPSKEEVPICIKVVKQKYHKKLKTVYLKATHIDIGGVLCMERLCKSLICCIKTHTREAPSLLCFWGFFLLPEGKF